MTQNTKSICIHTGWWRQSHNFSQFHSVFRVNCLRIGRKTKNKNINWKWPSCRTWRRRKGSRHWPCPCPDDPPVPQCRSQCWHCHLRDCLPVSPGYLRLTFWVTCLGWWRNSICSDFLRILSEWQHLLLVFSLHSLSNKCPQLVSNIIAGYLSSGF